jgi:aldose 1-epimerase
MKTGQAKELRAGDALCEIWPDAGGSIGRWMISGQEMFRRYDAHNATQPPSLGMASFPLVPYSNRIGFGRFDWGGREFHLTPNFSPEPHAIHGTGWRAAWQTEQLSADAIILRHRQYADGNWPWSFEAEQHIMLSHDALMLRLVVHNLCDQIVPLAFGHHPYFDSAGATLSFAASQLWPTGNDGLPSHAEVPTGMFDFRSGAPVCGRIVDNGFAGWDGKAQIHWDDRPFGLEIHADMQAAVVYVPDGEDYFCFEPVPHIINALNLPDATPPMPLVAPGSHFEAHIRFAAIPAKSNG